MRTPATERRPKATHQIRTPPVHSSGRVRGRNALAVSCPTTRKRGETDQCSVVSVPGGELRHTLVLLSHILEVRQTSVLLSHILEERHTGVLLSHILEVRQTSVLLSHILEERHTGVLLSHILEACPKKHSKRLQN
ncbi:unnamed protein product [Arctogadus glacialis]